MTLHKVAGATRITARRRVHLAWGMVVAFAVILAGCGGSDEAESSSEGFAPSPGAGGVDRGEVVLALTDADGDFLTYSVDVASLVLLRQDGTEVQALPAATVVDFAQYRELAEFITATSVPPGRYTGVRMVLDYSNADIQVEVNGEPRKAVVQDRAGNPLTTLETRIELANQRPLLVSAGGTSHLSVDFDLDASNLVDTTVSPPVVKVEPVLLADIAPEEAKPHRLRGVLRGIDRSGTTFRIRLQPFNVADSDFGAVTVYTNNATRFDVNGRAAGSTGGLQLLRDQPAEAPIWVFGELNASTRRLVASEVYAGSSVPGGELDGATGHVVARSAETLTLRGATVLRRNASVRFNDALTVRIGPNTPIRRIGDALPSPSNDVISVGQRITVLGSLNDDQADALVLDASAGFVHLHVTQVTGEAVSHREGELVMNVQRIDGRSAGVFDFAGTGQSAADDSDPEAYQVDVGTLNLAGLQPGNPVQVRGFVNAYGSAPPDFNASSVVMPAAGADARLVLSWDPPTAEPYVTADNRSISLSIENLGALRYVQRRGTVTDIAGLGTPTLRADLDGQGMFAIKEGRSVQVFRRFADFSNALVARLDGSRQALRITAMGEFDEANLTLITRRASVLLLNP